MMVYGSPRCGLPAWERWFVLEDREAKRALVCIEILRRYEGLLMAMPWQMIGTCMWAVLERPRRVTNRKEVDQIFCKAMRAKYFYFNKSELRSETTNGW